MPIPISVVTTTSVEESTGPSVEAVSYVTPTVVLTSASGRVMPLTGRGSSGVGRMDATTGVGLAPVDLFSAAVPDGNGSVFLGSRLSDREVFIPVVIGGAGYVSLRENRRDLEALLADGPTTITAVQPDDGSFRWCTAYYVGGMEGDYGRSAAGVDWQKVGLAFRALDPLAYGVQAAQSWMVTGAARPFLSATEAFFPVVLGDSLVGGERTLTNAGDLDAWPVTTVTGPGSGLTLQNLTTGKSFTLTGTITEPITIDARRVVADVFDSRGNLWDRVSLGSSLFPLVRGENRIKVTLTGADATSSVSMRWNPPYRSLH